MSDRNLERPATQSDITIIGAGVAGCASAIAIKNSQPDLRVIIVERGHPESKAGSDETCNYQQQVRPRIGETLPPQVMLPLKRLGIWQQFQSAGFIDAHGTTALWGDDLPHSNEYIYSAYGNGWHLQRAEFDALLLAEAKRRGVEILPATSLQSVHKGGFGWCLKLQAAGRPELPSTTPGEMNHQSHFVIDASGRSAKVARGLGYEVQNFDKLTGIYRFYNTDKKSSMHSDKSTLVESAGIGWWYTAKLPQQQQVVALMTDHDLLKSNGLAGADEFDRALSTTQLIKDKIRGLTATAPPIVTVAHTQCLNKVAGHGWLAVGDAAFTFDPLSSLGMFKALRMAILASYAVHDFLNSKDTELAKYQQLAQSEFRNYSVKHQEYYAEEMRFASEPFWSRRLVA